MAWDNEGTRAGDYGTCAPCGNTYHADDPAWADDTPAGRDPICQNCRDNEKEDTSRPWIWSDIHDVDPEITDMRPRDTNEDHQHDTGLELEMFGSAIP